MNLIGEKKLYEQMEQRARKIVAEICQIAPELLAQDQIHATEARIRAIFHARVPQFATEGRGSHRAHFVSAILSVVLPVEISPPEYEAIRHQAVGYHVDALLNFILMLIHDSPQGGAMTTCPKCGCDDEFNPTRGDVCVRVAECNLRASVRDLRAGVLAIVERMESRAYGLPTAPIRGPWPAAAYAIELRKVCGDGV